MGSNELNNHIIGWNIRLELLVERRTEVIEVYPVLASGGREMHAGAIYVDTVSCQSRWAKPS